MALVVDASAIVSLALNDEPADYAESVVSAVEADGGHVPHIFWYELAKRLGLPLATLDKDLLRAAPEVDVALFGTP